MIGAVTQEKGMQMIAPIIVTPFTGILCLFLLDLGIAVNTVAPGAIETDFGGGIMRDNPDMNALYASMTALGRVGLPEDIGPMVAGLLFDANRWVTGQRIEVSGGQAI